MTPPTPGQAPCPQCGQLWFAASPDPTQPPKCPRCFVPLLLPVTQWPGTLPTVEVGDWGEAPVPMAQEVPLFQPPPAPQQVPPPQYHAPQQRPPAAQQAPPPRSPKQAPSPQYQLPDPPQVASRVPAMSTARPPAQAPSNRGLQLLAGILFVGLALGVALLFLMRDDSQPERGGKKVAKKEDATEHSRPDDTGHEATRPGPTQPTDLLPETASLDEPSDDAAPAPSQAVYDNLLQVLKSGTPANRIVAARRLGNLRAHAQPALPALIAALDSSNPQLQRTIGGALLQVGPPKPGTGVERMLLAALRSKSPQARTYAAQMLAGETPVTIESVKPLVAALMDELPEIRAHCVQAIGKVGPPAQAVAFEPVLDRLVDTDQSVSQAAVATIATLGPPNAALRPGLVARLKHTDPRMRSAVAPLLAAMGTKGDDTLKVWQPLLKDTDPKLRLAALQALGSSMELIAEAGRDVVPLLADPDPAVRKAAAHSAIHLGKIIGASSATATAYASETDPAVKLELAEALVTLVKPDLSNLSAFRLILKSGSPALREEAAQKLATIGADAKEALPELITCVGDETPGVRVAALKALTAMGSDCKMAVPVVAALFDKEMTPIPVLVAAVEVLGVGGPDGGEHLEKLVKKAVPAEVKEQLCIAFSLRKMLPDPVQLWLFDQSETLIKSREVIATALAKKGSDAVIESMLQRTHLYRPAKGGNPPEMYPVEYRQWVLSVFAKMDLQTNATQETRTKVIERMKYLSRNDKAPEIVAGANAVLKKQN